MSMTKGEAMKAAAIAAEVIDLLEAHIHEIDTMETYGQEEKGSWKLTKAYPDDNAPQDAAYGSGPSTTRAALKRRSMDLSRALADLRRS